MSEPIIRVISPDAQHPLRIAILGQGSIEEPPIKPGDDAIETCHVGIYLDDVLVSIASLYQEACPDDPQPGDWRLRGMATLPEYEGKGYGRLALLHCIDHARKYGGQRIWCNARENALGFYQRMDFEVLGGPYSVDGKHQHWLLALELN